MVYSFVMFAMLILFPIILFPMVAEAQVQTFTTLPSLLIPLEPTEALPASGTQGGYLFNLRPLGADFGRSLADHGIYIVGKNLSEGLANVSGGLKRGAFFEGYTALGFDLDMERIAGSTGGAVHFLIDDLQGRVVDAIDDPAAQFSMRVENIYGDTVFGDKVAGDLVAGNKNVHTY